MWFSIIYEELKQNIDTSDDDVVQWIRSKVFVTKVLGVRISAAAKLQILLEKYWKKWGGALADGSPPPKKISYFFGVFSFLSLPSADVILGRAFAECLTRGTRQRIPLPINSLPSGLCRVGARQSIYRVREGPLPSARALGKVSESCSVVILSRATFLSQKWGRGGGYFGLV